jgi:LysM repeat protein
VQEYLPAPERRYPSPSAQRRSGEHWKARVGLGFVVVLTLCSAAVMFRIAGLGVGSAVTSLRGPSQARAGTTPAAAAQSGPAGQSAAPAAGQPTAAPAAAPAGAAGAPAVATATPAAPAATPTTRPGQREHVVEAGDSLFAIATRYNTTVDAVVAANNLPSRTTILNIGQKLVIPA